MNLTIPEQLDALLASLKAGIRRYVVIRGVALVLGLLAILFWVTLGIDSLWFSFTRLELPRSTRLLLIFASLAVLLFVLFHSLIWQLLIQLRRRALALVLEKRFPQLNDRLITVVEVAEQEQKNHTTTIENSALSQNMLQRTLQEACQITQNLQVKDVFNLQPLKKAVGLAVVALISIAATAVASPQTLSHWSKAYVKLADDYWDRANALEVFVLAQPGDRVRSFENREIKHAAGTDLTILVETVPGKQAPEQVLLSYRTATGAKARALMTPAGEGKFRHTLGNLVDPLEFHVTGGDFTTIQPYRVLTVPEPQIESLLAECEYPEYTGWNAVDTGEETLRRIASAELTVPMETRLLLLAKPTKPLTRMRVVGSSFELDLKRDSATQQVQANCRFLDDRGTVVKQTPLVVAGDPLISAEGLLVKIPLRVTQTAAAQPESENSGESTAAEDLESQDDSTGVESAGVESAEVTLPAELQELVIVQGESLRIFLEDTDGIMNLEPARLKIQGRPDDPPTVQTRLAGVGKSVTRKAIIPLSGVVQDDYGIEKIHFEYRVEPQTESREQPTARQTGGGQTFLMEKTAENPTEKLDILPLELKVDDILYVTLVAVDADNLNGPHVSRGETYRMKIVSDEELLSLLHQDEMNLRRRFEHVIEELTRSRNDLEEAARVALENSTESSANPVTVLAEAVQRTLNMVQKDTVETDAIRVAFEGIREELLNNRVDTPQIRNRLEGKIIEPLGQVLQQEFAVAEEHLRLLDFNLRSQQTASVTAVQCVADVDQILLQLNQILQEMRKLESFQEVIELLKGIIEEERALKEKTETERKKRLIDLLN